MTGVDGGAGPGARTGRRWDVALSFAGAQRDYVGQVADALKARGVCCFYDADKQVRLWGTHLAEELPRIYARETAAVVVFISADYAGRDWTRLERRAAFSRAVIEAGVYVLPARFDDSELPGLLPDVVAVDLRCCTPGQFADLIVAKLADLSISPSPPPGGVGRVPTGGARVGGAMTPRVAERAVVEGQFTYQDFDLLIEPGPPGSYRARVLRSPAGESASVQFALPFSRLELENLVLKVGRARRRSRGPGRPESAPLKDFGGKLYGAVFQDELRDALQRSLSLTSAPQAGLRLRLRLADTPDLAELPWEFLYDPRHNRFLALSRRTPLVRYLDLPEPPRPLDVEGPLRVLVMISNPRGYPALDVEREWSLLTDALAEQQGRGRVVVERLAANMSVLRGRLRREEFHVFHFVGHGFYRPDWGDGVLVMEDRAGQAQEVTGEELGGLLNEYDLTRLAVLNACEGARSGASDPFAGVARSLIQQGLPAVVAMQFEICDDVAIVFAREFYGSISDGYPLEAALAEARGAIRDEGNPTEWGTPVLYSRAPDGRLFTLPSLAETGGAWQQAEQLRQQIRDQDAARNWDAVAAASDQVAAPDPGAVGPAEEENAGTAVDHNGQATADRQQLGHRKETGEDASPARVDKTQPSRDGNKKTRRRIRPTRLYSGIVGAIVLASLLTVSLLLSSAGGSSSGIAALSGMLNGSGSTLQLTFQHAAFSSLKSIAPHLTVNYGGGGSGKGRTDLASGMVNFAGSDEPVPVTEQASFRGKTVLYFPVAIGPITLSYNLAGLSKPLQLTAPVIAYIFEGKITRWNDSFIAAQNPGVTLPDTTITTAVRSDSSDTTQNFSEFLVKGVGSEWTLGSSSTIKWPSATRAGNGNGGVAQIIKSTPGAIGYVDYADAKAAGLSFASIKNQVGNFIAPSTKSAAAAAENAPVKSDLTFSCIWVPGAQSYPVTYQSWDLVFQSQSSSTTAKKLQGYIGYLLGAGQRLLPSLGYAPLPSNIDQMAKAQLSKIGT